MRRSVVALAALLMLVGIVVAVSAARTPVVNAAAGDPSGPYFPAGGVTHVDSAPWFETGDDIVVARSTDGRVMYSIGHGTWSGWAPGGWHEIPGGVRTPHKPTVSHPHGYGELVVVAVVNYDGRLMMTDRGNQPGSAWSPWREVPGNGRFLVGATFAPNSDDIEHWFNWTILAVDMQGRIVHSTYSLTNTAAGWSPWTEIFGGLRTHHEVTAMYFEGSVKTVARGVDNKLYHNTSGQGGWHPVAGADGISGTPQLGRMKGSPRLYLFSKRGNRMVYTWFDSKSGDNNPAWRDVPGDHEFSEPFLSPAVSTSGANIHVYAVSRVNATLGSMSLGISLAKTGELVAAEGYSAARGFEPVPRSESGELPPVNPGGPDWGASQPANGPLATPWLVGAASTVAAAEIPGNSTDLVVSRRADNRIFATQGRPTAQFGEPAYWAQYGWAEIPGGGLSGMAPAVATWGNTVYVMITGLDGTLWYQVYRAASRNWNSGWTQLPGMTFRSPPTLVVWENALYAIGVSSTSNGIWYQKAYTTFDTGWRQLSGTLANMDLDGAVGAADFGTRLALATRTTDGRIYTRGVGAFADTGWVEVPGGGRANAAPALAKTYPYLLQVVIRGLDNTIWYQTAKDTLGTWRPGWTLLPGASPTNTQGPAAMSRAGRIEVFAVSTSAPAGPGVFVGSFTNTGLTDPWNVEAWWSVLPYSRKHPVPTNGSGQPIPAPPPPGTPFQQPVFPNVDWYVFCARWAPHAPTPPPPHDPNGAMWGTFPVLGASQTAAFNDGLAFVSTDFDGLGAYPPVSFTLGGCAEDTVAATGARQS